MTTALQIADRSAHPVDIVEQLATLHDWSFDRSADDEMNISVSGAWSDYHVSINSQDSPESLHLASVFDLRVPAARCEEARRLISLINEQLWLGHFDLWAQEGAVMFRHGQLFVGGIAPTVEQCDALVHTALETCERYFQSFQFVLWAGKSAREALDACLFETVGEA
jgi:hypothetical protein